jgi:hypothetical protein
MVINQKNFIDGMKSGNYSKIIAGILTVAILGLIIFAGPVKAFVLGLDIDGSDSVDKGENIKFIATLNIENMDKYLPVKELYLFFNDGMVCTFEVDGTEISDCSGITITPILIDLNENSGYGYGYGYDSDYGYGYDFDYGYGYGYDYGYGGKEINLIYHITLDTENTNYPIGTYESQLKALIGDEIFKSKDKPEFTISAVGESDDDGTSGGTRISRTTLDLLIGSNLNLQTGITYTFEIDGVEHKLVITSFDADENYVWVTISSDPQNVRLDFGEAIEIDVDGDGINDISLELVRIDNNGHIGIAYYVLDDEGNKLGEPEVIELFGDEEDEPSFIAGITGAVVGTLGTPGIIAVIVFLVGLVGLTIIVKVVRSKKQIVKSNL